MEFNEDEKVLEIIKNFRFLRNSGYHETEISAGHRENPSLTYRNSKLAIEIKVLGSEQSWDVVFAKTSLSQLFKKHTSFAISDFFSRFDAGMMKGRNYSLKALSLFVQNHLMGVVNGKKWISDFKKELN